MIAAIDKNQEQQKNALPRAQQEASTGGTATIVDNRPATVFQRKLKTTMENADTNTKPVQMKNNTGLPDNLKSGIENLSGYSMDDVKVHYNSNKPAQLQAHAYAQGTDIHMAPGQEKHLPHEAWHVVQQKQGRVKPTMQFKGKANINNDAGLEKEADVMGKRAHDGNRVHSQTKPHQEQENRSTTGIYQMVFDEESDNEKLGRIHRWIKSQPAKPEPDLFYNYIYSTLGVETDSVYESNINEEGLVEDTRFVPQSVLGSIIKEYLAQKDKSVKKKTKLSKLYDKVVEGGKNLTNKETKHLRGLAYKYGNYFHIRRPKSVSVEGEKLDERMILNINSQQSAARLLTHIAEGWDEKTTDWRRYVWSGKFLAMSPDARNDKPDLKYDKVVIYYDKTYRKEIKEGVEANLPENERNENISGFYVKLSKGIGIGEEEVGELGSSFTDRRANTLVQWIMDEKGWGETYDMSEADFIKEAKEAVHAKMSLHDNITGTPLPTLPEYEYNNDMIDELARSVSEREPDNTMFDDLLANLTSEVNQTIDFRLPSEE